MYEAVLCSRPCIEIIQTYTIFFFPHAEKDIFSNIALNRVLRLPKDSTRYDVLNAQKIIGVENKNVSVMKKKTRELYIFFPNFIYSVFVYTHNVTKNEIW